ncbi:MAG: BamA/TamA family outer membrane protein [Myxococcota bacterium]
MSDATAQHDEADEPADRGFEAAAVDEEDGTGWAAFPFGLYSPETHLALGAFGVAFFRMPGEAEDTRTSSVALLGLGTTRSQAIVELIPEFYFDSERWHLWTKFDFRLFPDSYFGIGPTAPEAAEERYDAISYRYRMLLRRQLVSALRIGFWADAQHFTITETIDNGVFDREDVQGEDGGFTLGLGARVDWDTRDNPIDARSGAYYQGSFTSWLAPFSDHTFSRLTFDLRQYVTLTGTHSLAFQLYADLSFGRPPFYLMPGIGGPYLMRGYFEGRYRDAGAVLGQVEYRFPIFWRFRGVAFVSAGEVAPRIDQVDLSNPKVAGGGGLRFVINEDQRLAVRADLGVTPEGWGLYLNISEAF